MWIKFSEKKPIIGTYLITHSPGIRKGEYYIDDHRNWDGSWLKFAIMPHPASHWWNGEPNIETAIENWKQTQCPME